ncbi:hypothetical protein VCHA54O485_100032 [Vibrio chagasii]|nr:hypothetical protein VCHA54O485_100032 [Vibrio chagasii]CAH7167951.1 hypothetical protein VCHA54P501_120032 [Vibrio chagasii]CAH7359000.1 hypothetical protein VCHA55P509_70032 [Vibrio chagasii]
MKRIKRLDGLDRQCSNMGQLCVPEGCHIEQNDLSPADSDQTKSDKRALDETMIDLLTQKGSAPIYYEFYTILECTYSRLDVLQELRVM